MLKKYLDLTEQIATANAKIKVAAIALDKKVLDQYKKLTEEDVKTGEGRSDAYRLRCVINEPK